jgi:hypothetical protein
VTRGSLAEAAKAFSAARDAASRNGNDRDLYASHIYVGNVQVDQGDGAGALQSYRDGLMIIDRLAQSDPDNAGWQRDLGVLREDGRRAGRAGRPRRRAQVLSRQPRDPRPAGAIRSRQRRLAA